MLWIILCFVLLVYLYLSTNRFFEFVVGLSIMILVICFLNDWNIEQMFEYLRKELSPIINYFSDKMEGGKNEQ